jgi:purine-binding chemotaxis protein CheW
MDAGATLQKLGLEPPASAPPGGSAPPALPAQAEEPLTDILRREAEMLLVGFFVGRQEFVVPTQAVQEVIRFMPPTKLPTAPSFIAGVINLRGKVTPLVRLRDLLEIPGDGTDQDQFTIVCRRGGLQFGLMIERVHTMYRVTQNDVDWGIEAHFGVNVDYIAGLLKLRENLIGIVSVDRVVETIIKS